MGGQSKRYRGKKEDVWIQSDLWLLVRDKRVCSVAPHAGEKVLQTRIHINCWNEIHAVATDLGQNIGGQHARDLGGMAPIVGALDSRQRWRQWRGWW